jgi:hypothetical protein
MISTNVNAFVCTDESNEPARSQAPWIFKDIKQTAADQNGSDDRWPSLSKTIVPVEATNPFVIPKVNDGSQLRMAVVIVLPLLNAFT